MTSLIKAVLWVNEAFRAIECRSDLITSPDHLLTWVRVCVCGWGRRKPGRLGTTWSCWWWTRPGSRGTEAGTTAAAPWRRPSRSREPRRPAAQRLSVGLLPAHRPALAPRARWRKFPETCGRAGSDGKDEPGCVWVHGNLLRCGRGDTRKVSKWLEIRPLYSLDPFQSPALKLLQIRTHSRFIGVFFPAPFVVVVNKIKANKRETSWPGVVGLSLTSTNALLLCRFQ